MTIINVSKQIKLTITKAATSNFITDPLKSCKLCLLGNKENYKNSPRKNYTLNNDYSNHWSDKKLTIVSCIENWQGN